MTPITGNFVLFEDLIFNLCYLHITYFWELKKSICLSFRFSIRQKVVVSLLFVFVFVLSFRFVVEVLLCFGVWVLLFDGSS